MPEVKKSGEAVRGSVLSGGLLSVLLAPWVSMIVDRWTTVYSMTFPQGYDQILIAAFTAVVAWIAAAVKVRQLEGRPITDSLPFMKDKTNNAEDLTKEELKIIADRRAGWQDVQPTRVVLDNVTGENPNTPTLDLSDEERKLVEDFRKQPFRSGSNNLDEDPESTHKRSVVIPPTLFVNPPPPDVLKNEATRKGPRVPDHIE